MEINFNGETVSVMYDIPDYDPALSCNGGSYYQPTIVSSARDDEEFVIDDSSCGDFGTRIDVSLFRGGVEIAHAYYGSMLNEGQEYSDFTPGNPQHDFWLRFAAEQLGYSIPWMTHEV